VQATFQSISKALATNSAYTILNGKALLKHMHKHACGWLTINVLLLLLLLGWWWGRQSGCRCKLAVCCCWGVCDTRMHGAVLLVTSRCEQPGILGVLQQMAMKLAR